MKKTLHGVFPRYFLVTHVSNLFKKALLNQTTCQEVVHMNTVTVVATN